MEVAVEMAPAPVLTAETAADEATDSDGSDVSTATVAVPVAERAG